MSVTYNLTDWKQRWIDRLRSGELDQAEGLLKIHHDDDTFSYCCLGVLHDVVGGQWSPADICVAVDGVISTETGLLSPLMDLTGLEHEGQFRLDWVVVVDEPFAKQPVYKWVKSKRLPTEQNRYTSLARLNDAHVSFANIADIIESAPPGALFKETE